MLTDNSLLILDDDAPLRTRLRRAMESRGFEVMDAGSVAEGIDIVRKTPPAYAVLDMKLEDGSGLSLVSELRAKRAECRIVMLTGFGNIATAVAAVKAGALDYLPKPADPDSIAARCSAFSASTHRAPERRRPVFPRLPDPSPPLFPIVMLVVVRTAPMSR